MHLPVLDNYKLVNVTPPAAILDDASASTTEVDTKGWNHARFIVALGASDIALAALHVTESDATGTGHVEIDETDFSDATQTDIEGTALALPAADADNKLYVIDIQLEGRKRYLDLVATAGNGSTGTYVSAICILSRGEAAPVTNAGHGCGAVVQI